MKRGWVWPEKVVLGDADAFDASRDELRLSGDCDCATDGDVDSDLVDFDVTSHDARKVVDDCD